ncbi:MAG: exosome complex RNA-binding protein Rrp4 [Candidatus Bathyarchaeia archaeon]
MSVFFEERKLVFPGELLAEGDFSAGANVFRQGGRIYASRIGLAVQEDHTVSVIALRGVYEPKVGDLILGKVIDLGGSSWLLDIGSPYTGVLNASDVFGRGFSPQSDELSKALAIGDVVIAEVLQFDRTRGPLLTIRGPGLGKVTRGRIEKVTPAKIPRVIGKKGSMISLLTRETGCELTVGKNGWILIAGKTWEDEELVSAALRKIEREAHVPGLTDRMTEFLKSRGKRGV